MLMTSLIFGCFETFWACTVFLPNFRVNLWGFFPLSNIGVARTPSKIGLTSGIRCVGTAMHSTLLFSCQPEKHKNQIQYPMAWRNWPAMVVKHYCVRFKIRHYLFLQSSLYTDRQQCLPCKVNHFHKGLRSRLLDRAAVFLQGHFDVQNNTMATKNIFSETFLGGVLTIQRQMVEIPFQRPGKLSFFQFCFYFLLVPP